MEQLPFDIAQKLENLPVVQFDTNDEFQKIITSLDFTDIFNYYKENYLPDVLKAKPEIYQRVSLYLTLTNQDSSFIEQTDTILYKRPVPSIEEFLSNKFFMGYSNATLYDFWKTQLNQIFNEGSPIRKVIFSGCIGSGKSTVARKAFVYALYRILCLRYPRSVFNIDQDATIANVVISMTLKQVYETNILPFVKLMESMPCFQRVMSQRSFENFDLTNPNCPIPFVCEKSTGNIYFPDNIIITCGSNQGHFTGYNVVNSFCFTGDTKVYTNHGIVTFASLLRQFKNGINFKTYCIDRNGIKKEVKILDVQETRKVTELIKIYYEDNKYITCTPDHPFVISNPNINDPHIIYENGVAYKQAQYLTEEDEIASENQAYVYELIDNRPDSKNFNLPFYVGVSSHSNTISPIFNTQYSRAATHFTAKALRQDPNILKKSIIKDILSRNFTPDIKIVKTALTLNEAYTLEKQLIQQYGKRSTGSGILANLSDGGEGAPFLPAEIILRKSKKISETKLKQSQQKILMTLDWLSDTKNLYYIWLVNEMRKANTQKLKKQAASTPERIEIARKKIIAYNKSEKHRKRTAELNHLFPKVSSKESRLKLAKSQALCWSKKTEKEKQEANLAKSMGRAWNVLKRIDGIIVNESIFNSHRSTGSRLANTEPVWKTIINKVGGIEAFLSYIEERFGRKFIYED